MLTHTICSFISWQLSSRQILSSQMHCSHVLEITLVYTSIYVPHSLVVVVDLDYKRLVHRSTIICRTENDSSFNCGHVMDPFELKFAGSLRRLQNHVNIMQFV